MKIKSNSTVMCRWIAKWLALEWVGYNTVLAVMAYLLIGNLWKSITLVLVVSSVSLIGAITSFFVFKKQFNIMLSIYIADLEDDNDEH